METLLTHAFVRHYLAELKVVTMPAPPDNRVIPQENPVPMWIPPQELMKGLLTTQLLETMVQVPWLKCSEIRTDVIWFHQLFLFPGVTDSPSLEADDISVSLEDHSGK
jgi:hypothetical protein